MDIVSLSFAVRFSMRNARMPSKTVCLGSEREQDQTIELAHDVVTNENDKNSESVLIKRGKVFI
jgi:hypothetical protein